MHERYHTGYTLKCIEGSGENLINYFGKEKFDLVISANAIDHSINPRLFVENMAAVLKHKGLLILDCYIKEGSREGWKGLHKWNTEVAGTDLLLSNKDGSVNKESLPAGLNISVVLANMYKDRYVFTYIKG